MVYTYKVRTNKHRHTQHTHIYPTEKKKKLTADWKFHEGDPLNEKVAGLKRRQP